MTSPSNPIVFDRRALAVRRASAIRAARPGADVLAVIAADDIAERLQTLARRFGTALVAGPPTDAVARAVKASGRVDRVIRADVLTEGLPGAMPACVVIDDEVPPFADASLDLIVSALSLQWVNDLPGALVQFRRALRPDGLFLATFVGGDSLGELREAFLVAEAEITGGVTPRVAPFADVRDLGGLLQRAGFALPVTDQDHLTLRYATPLDLIRDLKAMGAGNVLAERSRRFTSRRILARAMDHYAERATDADGRVRATITLVSMSGWAPHESQQQPLRPGSARTRLADALGTREERLDR
jgi:SAM-dependent methyltransferase